MATTRYLAMTASEFAAANVRPPNIAWMACHFSPYESGVTNLPDILPQNSLLILNDRIPFCHHDIQNIAETLVMAAEKLQLKGLLLDFQQQNHSLMDLSTQLIDLLPCPVAVPAEYAVDLNCPVFLPPCPHHIPIKEYVSPWQRREIWLDLAPNAETITLTENGAAIYSCSSCQKDANSHMDQRLHCHYSIQNMDHGVQFTLWRTASDLDNLEQNAETLGITTLVGLYRELWFSE